MSYFIAALLGAVGWTLTEYLMHRFNGHGMRGQTHFSRQHLAHHAQPHTFAPLHEKALAAGVVLGPLTVGSGWFLGTMGLVFSASFALTYLGYEWLHRRIHSARPLNRYGRWARKHHLHHHFNTPAGNHGVTVDLWDRVFGTLAPAETVRVPRRHAPHWLVEPATGEARAEYAEDYVLRGRARNRSRVA